MVIAWGEARFEVDAEAKTVRIIVDKELYYKILEVLEWATIQKGWCTSKKLGELCRYVVLGYDVKIEVVAKSEE